MIYQSGYLTIKGYDERFGIYRLGFPNREVEVGDYDSFFRRQNGVIRDLEWKKTFVTKSVETQRDVVPLHFEGRNSDFFYNLANLCKFVGIKFNIAMLYLADEMLKNRHKTFTLTIGKPIPWQTFDKSKTPAQWAQFVKDVVYKL